MSKEKRQLPNVPKSERAVLHEGTDPKRRKKVAVRKPIKKKNWLERNYMVTIIVLVFFVLITNFRGCIHDARYKRETSELIVEYDSIVGVKDNQIKELSDILDASQDENQRLIYELKIAGVKVEEADKRAKAIQSTAEKVKSNTTIEIKADTTRNQIDKNN